jgi:hypothetical protein
MKRGIVAVLAFLSAGVANAGAFCDSASFVAFDELVRQKERFLNVRVQTHGVLRTDAKESTLITQGESAKRGLRVESDAAAESYAREHALPADPTFNVVADFVSKLRLRDGDKAPVDMSKIVQYRQQRLLCGRVIKGSSGYVFAIDDSVLERTYLLPDRHRKR